MPATYHPVGQSSVANPNSFEFDQGDLDPSGRLTVPYSGIVSPPAVFVYDENAERLFPGERDLSPGNSSGWVELNFESIVFSGPCRGKIL